MKHLFTLILSLTFASLLFSQEAYDDCNNAFVIPNPGSYCSAVDEFNNISATTSSMPDYGLASCWTDAQDDVWFVFMTSTMPLDFTVTVNGATMVMPQVAIYRGDCTGFAELSCQQSLVNDTSVELDLLGLDPNETYYIRINDYSATAASNEGTFQLCVEEYIPETNMMTGTTAACDGILYDSGGPMADYGNGENLTYTICPSETNTCIIFNISDYDLENNFDNLFMYDGPTIAAPLIGQITGTGTNYEVVAFSGCLTVQFTSDGSVTDPGWSATWQCDIAGCPPPPSQIDCAAPISIAALPYDNDGLSTCSASNDYNGSNACGTTFMDGPDYVFEYVSPGNECVAITIDGTNNFTGLFVMDNCPDGGATNCISNATGTNPSIDLIKFDDPGTYYIVVSTQSLACGPFDILVESIMCPLPSNCISSTVIPALPFNQGGFSSCAVGNDFSSADACGSAFMNGEDYVFTYTSLGGECAEISVTGANPDAAVFVLDGCPDDPMTTCIEDDEGPNPYIFSANFDDPGTYYIVVSSLGDCTNFGLNIENAVCITPPNPTACEGTIFDDGGPAGNYSNNANEVFTVCPDDPNECITLNVASYEIETNFDALTIYDGPSIASPVIASLDGVGGGFATSASSGCMTIQFTSDGSVNLAGFSASWSCSLFECPPIIIYPPASNCDDAIDLTYCNTQIATFLAQEGNTNFVITPQNQGCMAAPQERYVWFYVDVQNDGTFAFTLYGNTPSDIDFNVYGPFADYNSACPLIPTSVPVRSSWTGGNGPTGLLAGNVDYWDCDPTVPNPTGPAGAGGNQLVAPINALQGEVYLVLIDDFGGNTFDDGININFGGSDPQIFGTPAPFTISQDTVVCGGDGVELEVTGGELYFWTPTGSLSCSDCPNPIATPDTTTTYQVIGNSYCGGQDVLTVLVEVVNIDAGPDAVLCIGDSYQINSTNTYAGGTHSWAPVTGLSCTDCPNPLATPTETTTYYISYATALCNSDVMDSVTIVIEPVPVAVVQASEVICFGDGYNIGGPLQPEVVYSWLPIDGLSCTDCPDPLAAPTETMTYELITSTQTCGSDTAYVTVTVAEVNIGPDVTICDGQVHQFDIGASGDLAISLGWSPAAGLSCTDCPNPVASPTETTTYYFEMLLPNCILRDTAVVTYVPSAQPETIDDTAICAGESIFIGGNAIGNFVYDWTPIGSLSCSDCPNPEATPTETTTYYVTSSSGACIYYDTLTIFTTDDVSIGPDVTICEGETYLFDIGNAGDGALSISWTPSNGLACITCPNPSASPSETTTYYFEMELPGCTLRDTATVNVIETAQPAIIEDSVLCAGDALFLGGDATNNFTYSWMPANNLTCTDCPNPEASPTETTTYYLTAANAQCSIMDSVTIVVGGDFDVNIVTNDTTINQGNMIDIVTLISQTGQATIGDLTYTWLPPDGLNETNVQSPNASPLETTTYIVVAVSEAGCSGSDTITIEVLNPNFGVPNAFTPNNDELNDRFNIISNGNITIEELRIFDRWGELVYDNETPTSGWDGTYKGKKLPNDVYIYIGRVRLPDGQTMDLQGDVTLIR